MQVITAGVGIVYVLILFYLVHVLLEGDKKS